MNEHKKETEWLLKEKYQGVPSKAFFEDVEKLAAGEPLAYLIGHVPFLDTTIYLDSKPLIPRSETEFWVEKVIQEIKLKNPLPVLKTKTGQAPLERSLKQEGGSTSSVLRILDLCAGSGCIGISVLKEVAYTHVDFVEIDTIHHRTIAKNSMTNHIDERRTRTLGGDLFEHVSDHYDYILTNPPYLDPTKESRIEKSVEVYEPHQALFGGENGMEYIVRIIHNAPQYLRNNGVLYLEHEPEQAERIQAIATDHGFRDIVTYTDQYQVERYTRLVL